jgi:cell division protein FtsB
MQLPLTLPSLPVRSFRALLLVLVMFYLSFHAISGERGVLAWFKASRELELVKAELERAKMESAAISSKVALLKNDSVDLDMLDEQARRILGFARPDEVVILRSKQP